MATKQTTATKPNGSNGRERERVAIVALAQAIRLTVGVLRQVHPGGLVGDLELATERHLRAAEQALAWSE